MTFDEVKFYFYEQRANNFTVQWELLWESVCPIFLTSLRYILHSLTLMDGELAWDI